MSHKTLRIELIGHREGEYDGKVIKVPERKGVVPIVCRDALENGYQHGCIVEVFRNGTRCFAPAPIEKWADITIVEGDLGIKTYRYVPFDKTFLTDHGEDT